MIVKMLIVFAIILFLVSTFVLCFVYRSLRGLLRSAKMIDSKLALISAGYFVNDLRGSLRESSNMIFNGICGVEERLVSLEELGRAFLRKEQVQKLDAARKARRYPLSENESNVAARAEAPVKNTRRMKEDAHGEMKDIVG